MNLNNVHSKASKSGDTLLIAGPNSLLNGAVAVAARSTKQRDVRIARTAGEAFLALDTTNVSLAVIDIELAVAEGFHIIRTIKRADPKVGLIVLASDTEDPRVLVDCFIMGTDGVASKDQGLESLLTVMEVVQRGERAVPRWIADTLVDAVREVAKPQTWGVALSSRQIEVLRLVAEGLTDRAIADRLHISPTTVRSHLAVIFEKTSTDNRTAAARWLSSLNGGNVVKELHDC